MAQTTISYPVGKAFGTFPTSFTRTGYTLDGWFTKRIGGTQITTSTIVTAAATYYAHWACVAKCWKNDGTQNYQTVKGAAPSTTITLPTPTARTGYSFTKWFKESACTNAVGVAGASVKITSNVDYYAGWNPITYTVAYNANGGTGTTASSSHTYDVFAALTANGFSREGYSFGGWLKNTSDTDASYSDKESVKNLSSTQGASVPLYVKWNPNTYNVTLDPQGGTGGDTSVVAIYGSAMPEIELPTRIPYNFNGYYTSIGGVGTQYYDQDGASSRNYDLPSSTILYAYWSIENYLRFTDSDDNIYYSDEDTITGTEQVLNAGQSIAKLSNSSITTISYTGEGEENNCTAIEDNAFYIDDSTYNTTLTSVSIPGSVDTIGIRAFCNCKNMGTLTLAEGIQTIGKKAFQFCNISSLTIPSTVTSIGDGAFQDEVNLPSISVDAKNTSYKSVDGVLFSYDGTRLVQYPAGRDATAYTIPETVNIICPFSFSYTRNATSITIPSSVTSIGVWAFSECVALTSIAIPSSVTIIPQGGLAGCSSLKTVDIPSSITTIRNNAFQYCSSLESISIPDSVTQIGSYVFADCINLTSIDIQNSVTDIGYCAFSGCSGLTSINFNGTVTDWSNNTALKTYFGEITPSTPNTGTTAGGDFGNSLSIIFNALPYLVFTDADGNRYYSDEDTITATEQTLIDGSKLSNDIITGIAYDEGYDCCTSVDNEAFYYQKGLTSIVIPSSVTSIGYYAFYGCNMESISIPNNTTSIGQCAFGSCQNLTTIDVDSENSSYKSIDGVLFSKDGTAIIQYPSGKSNITEYTIPPGTTSIEDLSFAENGYITSVIIPSGVKTIGLHAFSCQFDADSQLTSITIPNTITNIANYAFEASSLTSIIFTDTISNWNSNTALTTYFGEATLNEGSTTEGTTAGGDFGNSLSITFKEESPCLLFTAKDGSGATTTYTSDENTITATEQTLTDGSKLSNDSITTVSYQGDGTKNNCTSIEASAFAGTKTGLGSSTIVYNTTLERVYLPPTITSIGESAFQYCSNVKSISIPRQTPITTINRYTFQLCTSLQALILPDSVTTILSSAAYGCTNLTEVTVGKNLTQVSSTAFGASHNINTIYFRGTWDEYNNNSVVVATFGTIYEGDGSTWASTKDGIIYGSSSSETAKHLHIVFNVTDW